MPSHGFMLMMMMMLEGCVRKRFSVSSSLFAKNFLFMIFNAFVVMCLVIKYNDQILLVFFFLLFLSHSFGFHSSNSVHIVEVMTDGFRKRIDWKTDQNHDDEYLLGFLVFFSPFPSNSSIWNSNFDGIFFCFGKPERGQKMHIQDKEKDSEGGKFK